MGTNITVKYKIEYKSAEELILKLAESHNLKRAYDVSQLLSCCISFETNTPADAFKFGNKVCKKSYIDFIRITVENKK